MIFCSIIITFDNENRYLIDCLESISEQNINNSEIILINNSNKNIDEILNDYENKLNITVKNFNQRLGVGRARNEGLNIASGKYVYFIDSDDYLYQDALAKLTDVALKTDTDFINGERINTVYIRDRFEEQGAIRNERQLLKKDMDDLEYSFELLSGTKTRHLEVLSALHTLIKRDLIEDIRFDENKRYLSDYEFILKVINNCNSFAGVENAIYAKRNRDDPVNSPSLNQEEQENAFLLYYDEYERSIDYIDKSNNPNLAKLKEFINNKYLRYYLKIFANKFYSNPDNEWREENFNKMSEISRGFDIKNQNYLIKKEIVALQNKDKSTLRKYIKIRAMSNKFKVMLKKRWMLKATIYNKFYNKRPVEKNKFIFESFLGKYYSDSPKYIYEYLYENYKDDFEFVWIINTNADIPGNPKRVKRFSLGYYKEIATSKYWVINGRQPKRLHKKPEQVIISTWHGTTLKKLGLDIGNVYGRDPNIKKSYINVAKQWDYLISPNPYTTEVLRSSFAYEGQIIESGYPRNDILYNATSDKIDQIKNDLKLPEGKKIILYAPTWRDDEFFDIGKVKFNLKLDLHALKEKFQDEYIVLLRMHYFIADNLDLNGLDDFAYDVSKYDDIAELYLISDMLITDYSSVFFDYANLKRPILFYTYDLEKYEDMLRGFYINMHEEVPGPLLKTNEEIIEAIENIEEVALKYHDRYDEFYDRFCGIEDGNASKRIFDEISKK